MPSISILLSNIWFIIYKASSCRQTRNLERQEVVETPPLLVGVVRTVPPSSHAGTAESTCARRVVGSQELGRGFLQRLPTDHMDGGVVPRGELLVFTEQGGGHSEDEEVAMVVSCGRGRGREGGRMVVPLSLQPVFYNSSCCSSPSESESCSSASSTSSSSSSSSSPAGAPPSAPPLSRNLVNPSSVLSPL